MTRSSRHHRPIIVVISLVGFLVLGASAAAAAITASGTGPTLTGVATRGEPIGKVVVIGDAFTPGGLVYIAVYDRLGAVLQEADLIADGPTAPGRNGSVDPAADPAEGTAFGATIGRWVTTAPTTFGADGSIDPARGYAAGGDFASEFDIPCGVTMDMRALDQSTAAWSNWTNARLGC